MATCRFNKCDGGGWLLTDEGTAVPCQCREQMIKRARASGISSVIPKRFQGVSFDRPPVPSLDPRTVQAVREYVDNISDNLVEGRGLWFMGDVGTGKTTLAMIVSKAAMQSGASVAIYSLPKLLAEIRKTYADGSEHSYTHFFNRLAEVDLLHIDDLGAERQTEWVLEQLYSLVNERYEQRRAIMVTTNLAPDALKDQIGERTVSRLSEMCGDPLRLDGADMRKVFQANL